MEMKNKNERLIPKEETSKHQGNFGNDENDWNTVHKLTFTKHEGANSKLNQDLLNDLRKNHFNYGNNNNEFKLSSQLYGAKNGAPSKLDANIAKDLKAHHFGEKEEMEYNTIYRDQFIWKKNPDYD